MRLRLSAATVRSMVMAFLMVMAIAGVMSGVSNRAIALDVLSPTTHRPETTVIQTVSWSFTADRFRDRLGDEITVVCPPNGVANRVWGSDVYSDHSSICTAAVHGGLITLAEGGAIAIRIHPGQSSYSGTTQNDVTSADFAQWPGSFTFTTLRDAVAGVLTTAQGETIALQIGTWQSTAESFSGQRHQLFAVYCPAGGTAASVWGSDIYRDASSICTAAVHAGKITTQSGGAIAFKMSTPMPFYIGNTRNGITSRHWQGGTSSFQFLNL